MKRKLHTPAGALKTALLAAAILAAPLTTQAQAVIDYSTLQPGEGFRVAARASFPAKDVNIIDTDTLDFNGDGFEDILLNVSATINYGGTSGTTFGNVVNSGLIILGSSADPAPDVEITSFSSLTAATNAITIFNPGNSNTPLRLASAGDFNNDGFDDVIIGYNGTDYSGFSTGGVQLLLGGPSVGFSNYNTFALPTLGGAIGTSGFGAAIDGAGDFNGDGIDDIIVGAPGANSGLGGLVYVFLGKSFLNQGGIRFTSLGPAALGEDDKSAKSISIDSVTLVGFTSGFNFGLRVSDAGDFNDDGYDDVLVGASEVFSSAPGDYIFFGQNFSSSSPFLIAESGDALVFRADSPGVVTRKFDSAGDFNADGIDDVVFLAPGGANIYFGQTNATSNQSYYHGNYPSLGYPNLMNFNISNGEDVASVGDVNGDGIDDMIIGAPDQYAAFVAPNSTFSAPGVAYVLFGDATPPQFLYNTELNGSNGFVFQYTGFGSGDAEFGTAVAGGDFNNDGLSDIIASAPDLIIDPSGIFQGGAFVLFGETGTTPPPPDDTEGPVLDFDQIITNSLAFDFTGSVSDPSGVRRVSARIQGNGYLSPAPAPAQSFDDFPTSTNFSFAADLSSLPPAEGIYDISGSARDNNTDSLGADAFNDTDQIFTGRFIYDITPPSFLDAFFDVSFVPNPSPVSTTGIGAPTPDRVYVNQDGDLVLNFTDLTEIVTPLLVDPFVLPGGASTISNVSTVDSGSGSTQLVLSMLFPTEGDLEVVIPAGAIGDQAGNVLNQEIRIPVTVDLTDPELLCEGAFRALNSGAEAGEFLTFSIQFTEPVSGIDENDFDVYGIGDVVDVTPGDGFSDTYLITVFTYPYFRSPEVNSKLISGGPFGSLLVLEFTPESDVVDQAGNTFDTGAYAYAEVAYPLGNLPNPALILSESSETDDRFGSSVAVQGNVAVIGADKAGIGGLAYVFTAIPNFDIIRPTGSVLPVEDNFSTFTEFVTLSAPDTLLNDGFGGDVAVSGEWIAVGASSHDLGTQANAGAVYLYRRNIFGKGFNDVSPANKGFIFEEPIELFTKITATVPTRDTRFGTVVELYGNILAVSEPFERRGGAVDIFTYDPCDDSWNFTQRIQPADIFRQDNFGISLALNEDTLVVGSNRDDDRGSDTGSVYVYNLVNGQFILSEKIVPAPAVRLDNVGTSVDINSLLLAFGAPGTDLTVRDSGVVYVYGDENFFQDAPSAQGIGFGDSYEPLTVITTENIALTSDAIGTTVALSGNSFFNIAITAGAPRSDLFGIDNGAAYVYYPESRGLGAPEATTTGFFSSPDFFLVDVLNTPKPGRNDLFGTSIDSSQTFVLVGAPGATHPEPEFWPSNKTGLGSFHNTLDFFND